MHRVLLSAALAAAMTVPAAADEIADTIRSALDAYEEGDIAYATDELAHAMQLLAAMKADSLSAYLPEAPAGWTREINTEMGAGMAMLGGGTGAEATYEGDGQRFRITLLADNPMVASMGAMLGNATLMAQMGKVRRINRVRFLEQDNSLSALVANRVLIQAQDGDPDAMAALLETIDFAALERWGS